MTEFDWRRAFSRLQFANPEPALREIAAYLHRVSKDDDASVDPNVLALIAQMIDPDEKRPSAKVKLEIRRLNRKAPPREPNYELRRFLEHQVDHLGEPVESVVADACKKFGASRAQCFRHLKVMRKYRKDLRELETLFARIRSSPDQPSQ